MTFIFGRKKCSACQEKEKELKEKGIHFTYFNLDNLDAEGMAYASFYEVFGKELPVVIEES
ncbi:MAG: hypothetical protein AB1847_23705 [bacterium]